MRINIGISNRHIHLTRSDADILFGKDYEFKKRNDLSQTGEYACEEVVKVRTDKDEFPYVRVLGPIRNYTQVEVSRDDALKLGINPPIRNSGDLENSESVWIEGPCGIIYKKNCCIRATRHIHCNKLDNIGHDNNDIVSVDYKGTIIPDVHIKMSDNYKLELHIDKSDASDYGIESGDYIDLD